MITQKLSLEQKTYFQETKDLVDTWARTNEPIAYSYNSRATYWGLALQAGIITNVMYDFAAEQYGSLWWYVGD
jgi:lipoprotein signal peptidase